MRKLELVIGGTTYQVEIVSQATNRATVVVNGVEYTVEIASNQGGLTMPVAGSAVSPPPAAATRPAPALPRPAAPAAPGAEVKGGLGELKAPMPGLILEVKVEVGSQVSRGEVVCRMEAMKMENNILAPVDGEVQAVNISQGAEVQTGQVLMVIG